MKLSRDIGAIMPRPNCISVPTKMCSAHDIFTVLLCVLVLVLEPTPAEWNEQKRANKNKSLRQFVIVEIGMGHSIHYT